jgi:succinate dehydrogenase/fumarate reductase flavoprotein subunit
MSTQVLVIGGGLSGLWAARARGLPPGVIRLNTQRGACSASVGKCEVGDVAAFVVGL